MSDDDLEKIRLQKAQDLVWKYDLLREDVDHWHGIQEYRVAFQES